MRRFWRNNGLSVVLFVLFVVSLFGQTVAGHRDYNDDQREHGHAAVAYGAYLRTPAFLEALAENWESEFLQMAAYVALTVFLFQKGSSESKDPDGGPADVDREPDPNRPGAPWPVRRGGLALALYKRSLTLSLAALFLMSFALHAVGGAGAYNQEEADHGGTERVTTLQYMAASRFWFESLQNWQSEFFSVFAVVVLSIYLRQHGSPESKPVDASYDETD